MFAYGDTIRSFPLTVTLFCRPNTITLSGEAFSDIKMRETSPWSWSPTTPWSLILKMFMSWKETFRLLRAVPSPEDDLHQSQGGE